MLNRGATGTKKNSIPANFNRALFVETMKDEPFRRACNCFFNKSVRHSDSTVFQAHRSDLQQISDKTSRNITHSDLIQDS